MLTEYAEFLARLHRALLGTVEVDRESSARLRPRTFTRGSPNRLSSRPSVCCATRRCTTASSSLRALATRRTWYRAAAGLMWGSRPLPDAVTRSTGTGAVLLGSAARRVLTRPCTAL